MAAKTGKDEEFISSGTEGSKKLSVRDFVSGRVFTREEVVAQLPFLLFLTLLAFVYISNHFSVEKLLKSCP